MSPFADVEGFGAERRDVHLLVADLHSRTLLRLGAASGVSLQGCSAGAKPLALPNPWKRRLRELDVLYG